MVCRVEGRDGTAATLGRAGRNYPNPLVTQGWEFQSTRLVGTAAQHRGKGGGASY
jgi:hypothetical protein